MFSADDLENKLTAHFIGSATTPLGLSEAAEVLDMTCVLQSETLMLHVCFSSVCLYYTGWPKKVSQHQFFKKSY